MMAEENAAPTPEQPAAPAPEPRELPARMTSDEAVALLNENDAPDEPQEGRKRDERGRFVPERGEDDSEEPAAAAAGSDHPEAEEPSDTSDEDADPSEEQSDDETEETEEPEEEIVKGEAKTRLRDGTTVAVADLKKAYEDLQEVKRGGIPAEIKAEIEKVSSDLQQRQQYLDKALPLAIEALKTALPPEPDDALWDADPIEAQIQQRKHDKAKERLTSLQGAGQEQAQRQQQEQAQQFQAYIQEQQSKLFEVRPELKDPQKAQAFYDRYIKVGQTLGFAKEELDQTYDTRLIHGMMTLAEKAEKWDKLQASKPKVQDKVKRAVPMAKPGRRVEPEQRRGAEVEQFRRRFDKSHSIDDAAALIGKLGL